MLIGCGDEGDEGDGGGLPAATVSQSRPLNPGGQVQETPLTRSRQVPPFWQGPEEHSSTSGGQRTRVSAQPGGPGVKGQVR